MRQNRRMGWSCVILGAVTWLGGPGRVEANGPKPGPVPPTLEIVVLDPNVDPLSNPAVRMVPGPYGNLEVDVPPVVLVHRYYYTGNRSFQGPLLPGGPSVVVVNHPKTGERLYIPVQMLPGSPRVRYTHNEIEYDYGKHGVSIHFCWLTGKPSVEYRNVMHLTRRIGNAKAAAVQVVKNMSARTGLTEATIYVADTTKNVVVTTADRIGDLNRMVAIPIMQVGQRIPGINYFVSSPEDRALDLRNAQIRRAEDAAARQQIFVPTNR